jgi:P2-related tail formation protein
MYAKMWKDDWAVKSRREEMEAALQIERNKEMRDVSDFFYLTHLS